MAVTRWRVLNFVNPLDRREPMELFLTQLQVRHPEDFLLYRHIHRYNLEIYGLSKSQNSTLKPLGRSFVLKWGTNRSWRHAILVQQYSLNILVCLDGVSWQGRSLPNMLTKRSPYFHLQLPMNETLEA